MQYIIDEKDYAILQKAKNIDGKEQINVWFCSPSAFSYGLSIMTSDETVKIIDKEYKEKLNYQYGLNDTLQKQVDEFSKIKNKWWYKLFSK